MPCTLFNMLSPRFYHQVSEAAIRDQVVLFKAKANNKQVYDLENAFTVPKVDVHRLADGVKRTPNLCLVRELAVERNCIIVERVCSCKQQAQDVKQRKYPEGV